MKYFNLIESSFIFSIDWKVVVTSGAPDHAAEDQSTPFCTAFRDICRAINPLIDGGRLNPNRRCNFMPMTPENFIYRILFGLTFIFCFIIAISNFQVKNGNMWSFLRILSLPVC